MVCRAWLARLVLLLLVPAGCGGGGTGSGGGGGGEADAGGGLAAEQVLRVNYGSEPPSLDPGLVTDVTSANVVNALMDPLIKLGEDLEPVQSLAERWEISQDGTTVTFLLRGDGRWTNGDPVTAHDFEYAWKRVVSPELGADYAYQFFGITGAQEYNSCEKDCAALADGVGVEAVDDHTLRVELTSPQPWFVQQTAHTSFLPVHRATVERHGDEWTEPENIVTNGPFRLTRWDHDSLLVLEKWDEWRDADTVTLERVEGRMISNATTTLQAFEAGEIDACIDRHTCVPLAEIERLKGSEVYVRRPALATQFLGINVANVPDVNVRRALAFAIDRQELIENVTKADEIPATSFTPQGMPGFDTIAQDFLPERADLDRAREFLARAGNAMRELSLFTSDDSASKELAVALQDMWRDLGLTIRIRSMEWAQFLEFIGPPPNEEVDLIWIGWVGDYVDDINFLELFTCEGGLNFTQYCHPRYDRLLEQARRTLDDDERHEIYARLEAMLTGEEGALPIIPVFWNSWVILRKPYVKGWEPNLLDQFDYTKVSIEEH